jgi:hypothetical protein
MPRLREAYPWKRAAQLRNPRTAETNAIYEAGRGELLALGYGEYLGEVFYAKPLGRALAQLIELRAATPPVLAVVNRWGGFVKWMKRARARERAKNKASSP